MPWFGKPVEVHQAYLLCACTRDIWLECCFFPQSKEVQLPKTWREPCNGRRGHRGSAKRSNCFWTGVFLASRKLQNAIKSWDLAGDCCNGKPCFAASRSTCDSPCRLTGKSTCNTGGDDDTARIRQNLGAGANFLFRGISRISRTPRHRRRARRVRVEDFPRAHYDRTSQGSRKDDGRRDRNSAARISGPRHLHVDVQRHWFDKERHHRHLLPTFLTCVGICTPLFLNEVGLFLALETKKWYGTLHNKPNG